ncbi:hypothetical protein K501DRAFT_288806 [Backusella circina FSU 941]|nr:hypothetical protein K501DRAFT_288806 [Backusella circina FSU 941]
MKLSNLPCILAAVALVQASAVEIRGVNPKNYDLYKPTKEGTWSCLDGSKVISFDAINDDYCDCPDGSDEPGTSACHNSYFYCANVGHIPAYIKSYAVNDGVCDEACCDGSDETNGLIKCPNNCKQVGEQYRNRQSILKQAASEGLVVKQQLIQDANSQIKKWEEEKTIIEDEIVLKKSNILRLQDELKELEAQQDAGQKHKKKCPPCETKSAELDILIDDVQLLMDELDTLQSILADMKRDHNHNYHDMAVKAAITGFDDFVERFEETKEAILTDVNDAKSKNEGFVNQNKENDADTQDNGEEEEEELSGEEKAMKEAIELARKSLNDAEGEVRELNVNLENINKQLDFDYGKDKEWLKLKDVCVEKNEGEYTYSICFLGDAYQKSNRDNARTHLGLRGTRCWNGPERSVKASIECGKENEIIEVSEPEKCEYHYRMKSPAVCETIEDPVLREPVFEKKPDVKKPIVHEEL